MAATDAVATADTAADTPDGTEPCIPTCASDLMVGACGDDGCGGLCFCPSATSCSADGICTCGVGCTETAGGELQSMGAGVVDWRGQPRIVGFGPSATEGLDLVLAEFDGLAWGPTSIASGFGLPRAIDARLSATGALHVLVSDSHGSGPSPVQWVRPNPAGGWDVTPFLELAASRTPSLRATASGTLVAAVVDDDGSQLRFARLEASGQWNEFARIDSLGETVAGVPKSWPYAWDLDRDGRPHVAYSCCGLAAPTLRYASWNGSRWTEHDFGDMGSVEGATRRNVVIALDGEGHPVIVAQGVFEGAPALSQHIWTGSGWQSTGLGSAGDAVPFGQLLAGAADSRGRFHLVYGVNDQLVYMRRINRDWSDSGSNNERMSPDSPLHLSLDPSNTPHAVYVDISGQLRWWTPLEP